MVPVGSCSPGVGGFWVGAYCRHLGRFRGQGFCSPFFAIHKWVRPCVSPGSLERTCSVSVTALNQVVCSDLVASSITKRFRRKTTTELCGVGDQRGVRVQVMAPPPCGGGPSTVAAVKEEEPPARLSLVRLPRVYSSRHRTTSGQPNRVDTRLQRSGLRPDARLVEQLVVDR